MVLGVSDYIKLLLSWNRSRKGIFAFGNVSIHFLFLYVITLFYNNNALDFFLGLDLIDRERK